MYSLDYKNRVTNFRSYQKRHFSMARASSERPKLPCQSKLFIISGKD